MSDLFAPPTNEEIAQRRANKPKYRPAEVARILTDQFGHKVTASVVRKWDLCFSPKEIRTKGENRNYSEGDIRFFNLIAVLRNLGYSLNAISDIKEELSNISKKGLDHPAAKDILSRIVRQREAFSQVQEFLTKGIL